MAKSIELLEVGASPLSAEVREAIARLWKQRKEELPAGTFDGPIFSLAGSAERTEGDETVYLTSYAHYAVNHLLDEPWRCRSVAAGYLPISADGAYILVRDVGSRSEYSGRVKFLSGAAHPQDVSGGRLDLRATADRELAEESPSMSRLVRGGLIGHGITIFRRAPVGVGMITIFPTRLPVTLDSILASWGTSQDDEEILEPVPIRETADLAAIPHVAYAIDVLSRELSRAAQSA